MHERQACSRGEVARKSGFAGRRTAENENTPHTLTVFHAKTAEQTEIWPRLLLLFWGEPRELKRNGRVALKTSLVDWGLPPLVLQRATQFIVFQDALDGLEGEVILRGASGDERACSLCVAILELDLFLWRHVPGQPCLSTFALAANPIAHEKAIVRGALLL